MAVVAYSRIPLNGRHLLRQVLYTIRYACVIMSACCTTLCKRLVEVKHIPRCDGAQIS